MLVAEAMLEFAEDLRAGVLRATSSYRAPTLRPE